MKQVPFFVLVLAAFTGASVEEDEPPEVAGSPEVAVAADIAASLDVEVPPDVAAFVQRLDSLRKAASLPDAAGGGDGLTLGPDAGILAAGVQDAARPREGPSPPDRR